MRILWYALGGGLGHLNRALAVLRHLTPQLPAQHEMLLLCNTPHNHLAIRQGIATLRLPTAYELGGRERAAQITRDTLTSLLPCDLLVVDTFPQGVHSEISLDLLQQAKQRLLINRHGGVTPENQSFLTHYQRILAPYTEAPIPQAEPVGAILNRTPEEALSRIDARHKLGIAKDDPAPAIVVMHAGDPGEVAALFWQIRLACDRLNFVHHLRLLSPTGLWNEHYPGAMAYYPASELLAGVDLLITGAGYNSYAEATCFGKRALFFPFRRSHDDQAGRLLPGQRWFDREMGPEELTGVMGELLGEEKETSPEGREKCTGAARMASAILTLLKQAH